ncbi:MAG: hypothetical protein K0S01_840 [Herbinix sp.]|jgi:hypothetical protein|nr:hypothetical protein [Herbinix sp.]
MPKERYLLIKSWGYSLWADVEHVMGQILVAELTGRIPVIYWGMNSMYSEALNTNSFELFFEPISSYTINDVVHPDFTYYPPVWNFSNVMIDDPDKLKWKYRDLVSMMSSNADVVVSDVYYHMSAIIPWIKPSHPMYGISAHQIYRQLYQYYLIPRPEVKRKINEFINSNTNFRDEKPIVGAHVRGNALVHEINQLYSANNFYTPNIWQFFNKYNARHLFLITDSKRIEKEYMKLYGSNDILIVSDSKKKPFQGPVRQCNTNYPNKRHKGAELIKDTFEVIKDTYLAAECDFFIGNGYSCLSNTVLRLKDWPETNIKLLY